METAPSLKPSKWDLALDTHHIGVVDGIRAISVLLVLWFHFWQQTWLMPVYQTPWLSWLGISAIDPVHFRRVGYLFVDMMVLLSGFCLFLPYARHMIEGGPYPSTKKFYLHRVARILPSYFLCVLVFFSIALLSGSYTSTEHMWRDLLSHLTFTFMFRMDTFAWTNINAALWTVAVEVQFYLIFPLLAKAFTKFHVLVYALMVGAGLAFIYLYAVHVDPLLLAVNSFPTFLPVFANGMAAACLYVLYAKYVKIKRVLGYVFLVVALVAAWLIAREVASCSAAKTAQDWQLRNRYELSLVFTLFVLATAFSCKAFRFLFSNAVMRLLSAISFNLYLWHQWIMVTLRKSLGFQSGADAAAAGTKMQILLTLEGLFFALIVAFAITYLFEKPIYRLMTREKPKGEPAHACSAQE